MALPLPTTIDITGYTTDQISNVVQNTENEIDILNTRIGTEDHPGTIAQQIQAKIDTFNNNDPRKFSTTRPEPNNDYIYWTWFKIRN